MAVEVSAETFVRANPDISICYQTFGSPTDQPLLMVMGLSGPMTWWPQVMCERLAEAGFFVIRFDNRDTGRSSRGRGRVTRRQIVSDFLGTSRFTGAAPYALTDLAGDAFAVLDDLGIESAHVCGMSMGGMIVQTMALARPDRVRSLVSMMSTTGKRMVGWQHPSLIPVLLKGAPDREGYITNSAKTWSIIESPAYPVSDEMRRARAAETFDRGISRSGVLRQMAAVLTQPDRGPALGRLDLPAAVIHGRADKMVHHSGGKETAKRIPGAELVLIDGMGHDLPEELWGRFVEVIRRTADRAD